MSHRTPLAAIYPALLAMACSCYPNDWKGEHCRPEYPVAPGEHGDSYEGDGRVLILDSEDASSIALAYPLDVRIYTLDEESYYDITGIREPRLLVRLSSNGRLSWCHRLVPDQPETVQLNLDGSDNLFSCDENLDPDSDAVLTLRNVGDGTGLGTTPHIKDAVLVGHYSENSGAELYEVTFHSFGGLDYTYDCQYLYE